MKNHAISKAVLEKKPASLGFGQSSRTLSRSSVSVHSWPHSFPLPVHSMH